MEAAYFIWGSFVKKTQGKQILMWRAYIWAAFPGGSEESNQHPPATKNVSVGLPLFLFFFIPYYFPNFIRKLHVGYLKLIPDLVFVVASDCEQGVCLCCFPVGDVRVARLKQEPFSWSIKFEEGLKFSCLLMRNAQAPRSWRLPRLCVRNSQRELLGLQF